MAMNAAEIAQALGGRQNGAGWMAHCPAHDDHNPSLSLQDSDDGKVLWHCHAGCSQEAVRIALVKLGLLPAMAPRATVIPPASSATLQPRDQIPENGLKLDQYAVAKGLPVDLLRRLGLSDVTRYGAPAV